MNQSHKMLLQPVDTVKFYQRHGDEKILTTGEIIFEEGDKEEIMYGVVEGEVDMYVNGKWVETIQKGDVFGVGALVHPDQLRTSTAIAKTDCVLASLNRQRFLFATQQTPMFALEVMRSYSDRFRRLKADL